MSEEWNGTRDRVEVRGSRDWGGEDGAGRKWGLLMAWVMWNLEFTVYEIYGFTFDMGEVSVEL